MGKPPPRVRHEKKAAGIVEIRIPRSTTFCSNRSIISNEEWDDDYEIHDDGKGSRRLRNGRSAGRKAHCRHWQARRGHDKSGRIARYGRAAAELARGAGPATGGKLTVTD